jgi:hypothetical protein
MDVSQHGSLCRQYIALSSGKNETTGRQNSDDREEGDTIEEQITHGTDSSEAGPVNRADVRASAESILYRYLLPGSEREIILPHMIVSNITVEIEQLRRDDPDVFSMAKDYVFEAMDRDAFPGFLKFRSQSNLVPPSRAVRLIIGSVALFLALWTAFALLFLEYSRNIRAWVSQGIKVCSFPITCLQVVLPFFVAIYCIIGYLYGIEPILGLANRVEYSFLYFHFIEDKTVRRTIHVRSIIVLSLTGIITTALSLLFILVPTPKKQIS